MRGLSVTMGQLINKAKLLPGLNDSNMSSVRTSTSTQLPTCADPTSTSTSFLPLNFGMRVTSHAGGMSNLSLDSFITVLT